MTVRDPNLEIEQDSGEGGEPEGFDLEKLKETLGFVSRSPSRRPRLAATVFAVVAGLALFGAAALPSTYNAQVKLLAQRDLVLPALSNPSRAVPRDADNPTKNVSEMIMRRENIVALAKDADLVDRFDMSRPLAMRLKDRLLSAIHGPMTEQEKLRAIVGTLEKKIVVTSDEATVTLSVDWGDPEMAFDLVALVQKNFLEARYDSDVAVISDAIAMLQEHAKSELAQIDAALAESQKLEVTESENAAAAAAPVRVPGAGVVARPVGPRAVVHPAPGVPVSALDTDAARALEEKRQQIRSLEAERQRQIDAFSGQLAQAQLTLTPLHPTVVGLQQKLDLLRQPSPELEQLKVEERALMAQIAPPLTAVAAPAAGAGGGAAAAASPRVAAGGSDAPAVAQAAPQSNGGSHETPAGQLARTKLEAAIHRYQDVEARIDSANIELDIARTAFKYRYTVITPADLPTKPKKPIAQVLGIAALPIAGILAFLVAAIADLASGLFLETWQVSRKLKLDVLGELELPG